LKLISQILDEFKAKTSDQERIAVLRKYPTELKTLLRATFHPNIKFVFNALPAFKPWDEKPGTAYITIPQVMKKIYLFEQGNPKAPANLSIQRKTEILVEFLKNMEVAETEILRGLFAKELNVPHLTYKLVKTAFPDILP
jgi:hypothetical protein